MKLLVLLNYLRITPQLNSHTHNNRQLSKQAVHIVILEYDFLSDFCQDKAKVLLIQKTDKGKIKWLLPTYDREQIGNFI